MVTQILRNPRDFRNPLVLPQQLYIQRDHGNFWNFTTLPILIVALVIVETPQINSLESAESVEEAVPSQDISLKRPRNESGQTTPERRTKLRQLLRLHLGHSGIS